jgi:methionyl-tRNA synthetase
MVYSHGHWLKDKKKMSKSIGNVVDPFEIINKYGIDSVRLYFLSQGPLNQDIDFVEDNLLQLHNKFLIDSYMNLLFRIASKKVIKKLGQTIHRP